MLNWRKPLIYSAFSISGYPVFTKYRFLKSVEYKSQNELLDLQNKKLETILKHACEYVPYYKKLLADSDSVKNGKVNLDNFTNIPPLTKNIIKTQKNNLYSRDHTKRSSFWNTTGGSTGEPTAFLQDKNFKAWGFAHRLLCNHWAGKEPGQPELKLWGSERDVFGEAEKISTTLRRRGFNVLVLSSFLMTEEIMMRYVKTWNHFKPRMVEAYTSSIFEFAKFLNRTQQKVATPSAVICSAETLTEDVRKVIEQTLGSVAINKYGSRDAGLIACECPKKEGLHEMLLHNKIEILDENHQPCQPEQCGKVHITTLNNFSMPLIRYDIGDMAVAARQRDCSCDRGSPMIEKIIGRHIETFKTKDGRKIPGEFFIHFVGVVYNKNFIKKFQVIQKDYDYILVRLVLLDEDIFKQYKPQIIKAIQKLMGDACKIEFEYVDDIKPLQSGKYLYTISEVE